jgi:hypothetical protein
VLDMVVEVARGKRGRPPGTITFLSGDVHNSYVTEIDHDQLGAGASRIVQAVCSPIRNPLPPLPSTGRSPRGPGSTTAWPPSRCAAGGSSCDGTPGWSGVRRSTRPNCSRLPESRSTERIPLSHRGTGRPECRLSSTGRWTRGTPARGVLRVGSGVNLRAAAAPLP